MTKRISKTALMAVAVMAATAAALTLHSRTAAQSQTVSFSSDHNEFMEQMAKLYEFTTDKKKAKEFVMRIDEYLMRVGDNQRLQHIDDCNRLARRKARAYPDYNNYFETCMAFEAKGFYGTANHAVWHNVLTAKLDNPKTQLRHINDYLKASADLVCENMLNRTASSRWFARGCSLQFIQNNDHLVVEVPTTTLVCCAQNDSIEVFETDGTFDMDTHRWTGRKGLVTWHRSGFSREECHADFGRYGIDMTKTGFSADSVTFINTKYFAEKLRGTLECKVMVIRTPEGAQYPKFRTSGERREIKDLFDNIDYSGGFSQIGSKFRGSGDPDEPAVVSIYRNDTLFVEAMSTSFTLQSNRIESGNASIVIHLDSGRITHPGLRFRYHDGPKEMTLLRSNEGIEKSPYFDTYHQVSLDVERIRWRVRDPEMMLQAVEGAAQSYSLFESLNYYREEDYHELQGMEFTHPLQNIKDFYYYAGRMPFTVAEYAEFLRLPANELRQMIINLSFGGFVTFDINTDIVTPTQRLFDYLLARVGKKDYDVIRFNSITDGRTPNAVLDLRNYDMVLNGVKGIAISDHQNVALYPDSASGWQVILKRNRDFRYDGKLDAGMMELYGNNFYFSYENFEIELDKIDSLRLKMVSEHLNRYGQQQLVYVQNTLSDLTGNLKIDKPDNKSGIKDYPEYPILTSTKESYVYYDKPSIQHGKYKRDRFYFAVDPFEITNINRLTKQNTEFAGTLTSNIFPPIEQKLVVRPDYSLGFVQEAPAEGYPIYNNRATYHNIVDLSNRGLRGDGILEYVASSSASNDFLFLPDEARGRTYDFTVSSAGERTTVPFPDVSLGHKQAVVVDGETRTGQTQVVFRPLDEYMSVENTFGKFGMFAARKNPSEYETRFSGRLLVTPNGMKGFGITDMPSASLESELMDFTDHTIVADTSFFCTLDRSTGEINSGQTRRNIIESQKQQKHYNSIGNRSGMTASNYSNETLRHFAIVDTMCREIAKVRDTVEMKCLYSVIDFDKREGYFAYKRGNGEWNSNTIKFKTLLKSYTWDMDRNIQVMGQLGSKGNRFVSTRERGDSLAFYVPYAEHDVDLDILSCREVKKIRTADATLNLNSKGIVIIHKNADIDEVDSVKVEVSTKTSYHSFYNSKIKIEGAKKYHGFGNYDFVNKEGEKYTIFMSSIVTDKEARTTARGNISETAAFRFDRYFNYKGDAMILAGRQLLEFDGAAQMIHDAAHGPRTFVRFTSVIDPKRVMIPIGDRIENWDHDQIHRNFFIRKDSTHVYSSFIESRVDYSDVPMLEGRGFLFHNDIFDRFDISTESKRNKPDTVGTRLSFEPDKDIITGFGRIDMGVDFGKSRPVEIRSAGDITDHRPTNTISLNTTTGIDFFFSTELATRIYRKVLDSKAEKCDTTSFRYELRMAELYDTTAIKTMLADRSKPLVPVKNSEELVLPETGPLFTFDNVEWIWHTPKKAYIADTTVNLMMMRGRNVNRKVHIKCELVSRKVGSSLTMLVESGQDWFFFAFRNANMQVLTSDKEFNQALMAIDPADRRNKSRGIQYTLAPDSKRKTFLRQFGIQTTQAEAGADADADAEAETETDAGPDAESAEGEAAQ